MTAPDAPEVEPLTLTLEEALARIGERGYMLAGYHHGDAREYVLRDVYSYFARGSFGHWKDAVEAVLGVPVVPRDDTADLATAYRVVFKKGKDAARDPTAELVEAVEEYLTALDAWSAEPFPAHVEKHQERQAAAEASLRAALARVKGGERL